MCAIIQDDSLTHLEHLIIEVEELHQRVVEMKEQQAFISGVIKEKQIECQQAKEQHEEKIRTLARQARRNRVRRVGRDTGLGSPGAEALSPDRRPAEVADAQECRPALASVLANLDTRLLDQALGEQRRQNLLGVGASNSDGKEALATTSGDAGLDALKQALEERLDELQCLNSIISDQAGALEGANTAAGLHLREAEFLALQSEVVSLIQVDTL
mmetsp:Transcript_87254/g.242032  ORF Transcript_87254/g.242032 Transcript_87254/m.242032 type:complete len:215 (-) Transcript_87254:149-793(-)|eukprot:CAMPEP_0179102082 /NCGR_PEP_ID=MMETSP0796-20121207/47231_1 /TAXON_ID=73915 /ORGANISM="Pyrodinium bahamense, Strain pbaha01" /LENGTH=214 /DNA_ID=CAMNT_0020799951 /DNA_START=77 /DNA_END=721 /DNA_ORIENTATION=+